MLFLFSACAALNVAVDMTGAESVVPDGEARGEAGKLVRRAGASLSQLLEARSGAAADGTELQDALQGKAPPADDPKYLKKCRAWPCSKKCCKRTCSLCDGVSLVEVSGAADEDAARATSQESDVWLQDGEVCYDPGVDHKPVRGFCRAACAGTHGDEPEALDWEAKAYGMLHKIGKALDDTRSLRCDSGLSCCVEPIEAQVEPVEGALVESSADVGSSGNLEAELAACPTGCSWRCRPVCIMNGKCKHWPSACEHPEDDDEPAA